MALSLWKSRDWPLGVATHKRTRAPGPHPPAPLPLCYCPLTPHPLGPQHKLPNGPSGSRLHSGPTVTNHPQSWVPEQALSPHLGASSTQARICLWFCCASQDLGTLASQRLRAPSSLSFPDQPSFLQQGYEGSEPTGVCVGARLNHFTRGLFHRTLLLPTILPLASRTDQFCSTVAPLSPGTHHAHTVITRGPHTPSRGPGVSLGPEWVFGARSLPVHTSLAETSS